MATAARIGRLNPTKTVLLLCDMQEKFARIIQHFNPIVETSNRVLDTCKILNIPYVVTEHYPKGYYIELEVNRVKNIFLN